MNRIFTMLLALAAISSCQKHVIDSADKQFSIQIDPKAGTLIQKKGTDTFLVSLQQTNMMKAVPLEYHLPPGATASSGIRPGWTGFPSFREKEYPTIYKDTVDLSLGKVHTFTVTQADGSTRQYAVAYKFRQEIIQLSTEYLDYITNIFFDGDVMYVTTPHALLVSRDDGKTFKKLDVYYGDTYPYKEILCVYAKGQKVFVGLRDGLGISSDGGETFSRIRYGEFSPVQALVAQGDTIYGAMYYGLVVSRDGGATFDTTSNGLKSIVHPDSYPALSGLYVKGNKVYATLAQGLYLSEDGGRSFANTGLYQNMTYPNLKSVHLQGDVLYLAGYGLSDTSFGLGQNLFDLHVGALRSANQVSGQGNSICFAEGEWMSISTDNGGSYQHVRPDTDLDLGAFSVNFKENVIYVGSLGAIVKVFTR